jgi:hypothetical protein
VVPTVFEIFAAYTVVAETIRQAAEKVDLAVYFAL